MHGYVVVWFISMCLGHLNCIGMTTNAIYHCKNYPVKVTSRVVTPVLGFIELVSVYYEDNVMTIHHPPHNSIKLH